MRTPLTMMKIRPCQYGFAAPVTKTYFAFYAHLSSYLTLAENQSVTEGAPIALTGRSGNAQNIPVAESHLHFEIRTTEFPYGGGPLTGRIDPGELLGYQFYSSHA
jgi:murein DD-endopeptidase MepM/ murein hydrolase activator NlpD